MNHLQTRSLGEAGVTVTISGRPWGVDHEVPSTRAKRHPNLTIKLLSGSDG